MDKAKLSDVFDGPSFQYPLVLPAAKVITSGRYHYMDFNAS